MADEIREKVAHDSELRSLHRFLEKKSIYDVEIAAEYDDCGTIGWWSNNWNDWDKLRAEERYDHWFSKNVRD